MSEGEDFFRASKICLSNFLVNNFLARFESKRVFKELFPSVLLECEAFFLLQERILAIGHERVRDCYKEKYADPEAEFIRLVPVLQRQP